MRFRMPKIGRTIELDDRIVSAYLKTVDPSELTESPFILAMKADFGHYPDENEMSQEELNRYCNNVLLQELEFSAAMSRILLHGGTLVLHYFVIPGRLGTAVDSEQDNVSPDGRQL